MRTVARIGWALPIFLLTGCETTIAVSGILGAGEALSGSLTHYSDGGTIELFGGPRTHCVGNFTYRRAGNKQTRGQGTLVCDDRRLGPFDFTLKDMIHGAGSGTLAGQSYSFTF